MGERTDELDTASDPVDISLPEGATTAGAQMTGSVSGAGYSEDVIGTYGEGYTEAGTSDDDIEHTRAEIEETRSQMSQTIDAIQEKLSPGNIARNAGETVRDATIGKAQNMVSNAGEAAKGFGSTIVETIRMNPVPAALAGIGLGWLVMSGRKQSGAAQSYRAYNYGDTYGYDASYGYRRGYQPAGTNYVTESGSDGVMGRMKDTAGNVTGRATDAVTTAATQTKDTAGAIAGQMADTVGGAAGQLQDTTAQALSTVGDMAGQAGSQIRQGTRQAQSGFQQMMQSNPLAVGAGAVALGLAIGLTIPETDKENEIMGPARDQLVDQAQQAVQDTTQKAQSVAQEAVGAAKEAAQSAVENQGTSGGSSTRS